MVLYDGFDDLCDPTAHLVAPEFAWLLVFFFPAVAEFLLLLSALDLQTSLLCLLDIWTDRVTPWCCFHPVPSSLLQECTCASFFRTCCPCHSSQPSLLCMWCLVKGEMFYFVLGRRSTWPDSEAQAIWYHLLPAMFWLQCWVLGLQLLPEDTGACEMSHSGNTSSNTFLGSTIQTSEATKLNGLHFLTPK